MLCGAFLDNPALLPKWSRAGATDCGRGLALEYQTMHLLGGERGSGGGGQVSNPDKIIHFQVAADVK